MISFDIETLGVRSSAVLLSVGCVRFSTDDPEKFKGMDINKVYQQYLDSSLFVKFAVKPQFASRTKDEEAMKWWLSLPTSVRNKSFNIKETDLMAGDALALIKDYCFQDDECPTLWARGGLDQIVFDDFCDWAGRPRVFEYWNWMDFRTALNLTKSTVSRGYCTVPRFDRTKVVKHDPVHDAAYDVVQLLYGE